MAPDLFTSTDSPANDIIQLIEHLGTNLRAEFTYRGQVREWPGPLLPSAFRHYWRTDRVYTCESPEIENSMCQVGQRFVELRRFNGFRDIVLSIAANREQIDTEEMKLLDFICHNEKIAAMLAEQPFADVMVRGLRADVYQRYKSQLTCWERIVNFVHRSLIRLNGCNQFLGYALGQSVSQQYVESSEYLDVTFSPLVAAFFATHDGPDLSPYPPEFVDNDAHALGIIYRFDVSQFSGSSSLDYNYYTAPPFVDTAKQLKNLERSKPPESEWDPRAFVINYLATDGGRDFRYLTLPNGTVDNSRIGRQFAGFLVPDELHRETRGPDGHQDVSFQAIEDLATGVGTTRFYFRHNRANGPYA